MTSKWDDKKQVSHADLWKFQILKRAKLVLSRAHIQRWVPTPNNSGDSASTLSAAQAASSSSSSCALGGQNIAKTAKRPGVSNELESRNGTEFVHGSKNEDQEIDDEDLHLGADIDPFDVSSEKKRKRPEFEVVTPPTSPAIPPTNAHKRRRLPSFPDIKNNIIPYLHPYGAPDFE